MITPLAIVVAVLVVGSLLGILVFAVVRDSNETERTERDALNRRIAAQRVADGKVLHLRVAGRIP
jgi:hypothetical protein